jgi:hypothetical protein
LFELLAIICHLSTFVKSSSSVSVVAKEYLQEFLCPHQQGILIQGLPALTNILVVIHGLVALANKQVAFSNQKVLNSDSLQLQGDLTVIHQKVHSLQPQEHLTLMHQKVL